MTITELIAQKQNAPKAEAAKSNDIRFMLVIPENKREDLRTLCDRLGEKQISFASELFVTALDAAVAEVAKADAAAKKTEQAAK